MARDRRTYEELSPHEQAEAQQAYDDVPYIDPSTPPPPSYWENRLLGRTLFDLPGSDERRKWQAWRSAHPVEIDYSVRELINNNINRPHINTNHLRDRYGDTIGWCPYYMARWHLTIAASVANHEVGWCEQGTADGSRRATILDVLANQNVEISQSNHTKSGHRIREINDSLEKIVEAIKAANLFHVEQYDPDAKPDFRIEVLDSKGMRALKPETRDQICDLDLEIRGHARILSDLIGKRIEASSSKDGKFDAGEDYVWRSKFAGYFGVAWKRMTNRTCTDSDPFIDWVTAGWNSLWPDAPEVNAWKAAALHARDNAEDYESHWLFKEIKPQSR